MAMLAEEDPGRNRWVHPTTNHDIIYAARRNAELNHRLRIEDKFIVSRPMLNMNVALSDNLPSRPKTSLAVMQDCSNKTTAIYWINTSFVGSGPVTPPRMAFSSTEEILNVIYPQWFLARGHNTDIEFGRFVAKVFAIDCCKSSRTCPRSFKMKALLHIHQTICDDAVEANDIITKLSTDKERLASEVNADPQQLANIDLEYAEYYTLRPLFRAMIIIIDDAWQRSQFMKVFLVRTGITAGLSAPISFDRLAPEIVGEPMMGGNVITVSLRAAIKFIMELEERERRFSPNQNDIAGQEERRVDVLRNLRQDYGYTGEEMKRPLSSWITRRQAEAVVVPITASSQLYTRRLRGELQHPCGPVI